MKSRDLKTFLSRFCSNRAAAWCSDELAKLWGMEINHSARGGKEHLARNGGKPSTKALKVLAWAKDKGKEHLSAMIETEKVFR